MTDLLSTFSPYILAFFRIGAFLTSCPLLMTRSVPFKVKWFMTMIMSVVLIDSVIQPSTLSGPLLMAMLSEILLGLVLGTSLQLCLSALNLSGNLLDTQMGLNARGLFDSQTASNESVIAKFFMLLGTSLFFYWNMHLVLWQGMKSMFELLPLGSLAYVFKTKSIVLSAQSIFVFGLMFSAPIVVSLWLLDVILAMVVKTMPQVNVFFIGLPIKILSGIALIAWVLNNITPLLYQHYVDGFRLWARLA